MKTKLALILITGLLFFAITGCVRTAPPAKTPSPSSEDIFYTIYYGKLDNPSIAKTDWSKYKLIIIKSLKEDAYYNLTDPAAYKMLHKIRDRGAQVFIYLNVGRPDEDSLIAATDKESWFYYAKKDISLYLYYADGVFLDKAGGLKSQAELRELKKLIDFIHDQGGQAIIGDLADTFQAQTENPMVKEFLPADYYQFESCWTYYTGNPQNPIFYYQSVPEQIRIINYGKENGAKILGLSWGSPDDTEKFKYVYLLSKIIGLSGLCYTNPAWQYEEGIYQPRLSYSLGKPLGNCATENGLYTRKYEGGTVKADTNTHRIWIRK